VRENVPATAIVTWMTRSITLGARDCESVNRADPRRADTPPPNCATHKSRGHLCASRYRMIVGGPGLFKARPEVPLL
jgi:hypothetical protein